MPLNVCLEIIEVLKAKQKTKQNNIKLFYLHLITDVIRLIHSVLVDFQLVHNLPFTPPGIRKTSYVVS